MKLDSRRLTLLLAIGLILAALALFLASAATPPAITVTWSTASELNTAGFNLLRGDNADGPFTRLNPEIIPASPDPLVGGTYAYTDTQVVFDQTYYYRVEEIEFGGGASPQGTIVVTAPHGTEPIFIVAAIVTTAVIIAGLLWTERPRRASTQP